MECICILLFMDYRPLKALFKSHPPIHTTLLFTALYISHIIHTLPAKPSDHWEVYWRTLWHADRRSWRIEPLTLWIVDSPLYFLSHRRPVYISSCHCGGKKHTTVSHQILSSVKIMNVWLSDRWSCQILQTELWWHWFCWSLILNANISPCTVEAFITLLYSHKKI